MRRNAANWLQLADKVYHYRRDQLSEAQGRELLTAAGDLKLKLRDRVDASNLKLAIETLERVLRNAGGRIYPMSSFVENVEFFFVAAIVILGLRAYFVQPFKIPTNSMWPSYYGMTHELDQPGAAPGAAKRLWRFVTLGAWHYQVTAPAAGELLIPVFGSTRLAVTEKPGYTAGIIPTTKREYTFSVGGESAKVTVPVDFDFEKVAEEALARDAHSSLQALVGSAARKGAVESSTMLVTFGGQRSEQRVYWIPTGRMVKKGEPIVSFDILTGDMLFVDRLSYNFAQPKVGSGFVFRTGNINHSEMADPNGRQIDQYYIKRLVGTPGDTLEIRGYELWRNGQPIRGADAFAKNARREGKYPGYRNERLLEVGKQVHVPANSYFALGDNSPNSKDSRFWGYIPDKDVVGRPLFIYYPFSRRWGPAR